MQFRGFRQFGVIGGLGMLLAWGATFVLMPPLLAWLDRGPRSRRRASKRAADASWRARSSRSPRVFAAAATAC